MAGFIQCRGIDARQKSLAGLKIWENGTISVAIICAKFMLFFVTCIYATVGISKKVNMISRYIFTGGSATAMAAMFLFLFSSSPVFAVSDAYLDELSSEAEDSAHVSPSKQKSVGSENSRLIKLEEFLLKEKPTTFKYYEKLAPTDKVKVLVVYESSSANKKETLAILRKKILDLYFKR